MPQLRFALRVSDPPQGFPGDTTADRPPAIVAVSIARRADRDAVATLATHCRAADPVGHFAPAGLLAELNGRPGRAVEAWLAWPAESTPGPVARVCPLGLVALVAAGPAAHPRFSIAWLLVHPDCRRLGVGTALVAHAVAHARRLGATRVSAETLSSWPAAVGFWQSVGFTQDS